MEQLMKQMETVKSDVGMCYKSTSLISVAEIIHETVKSFKGEKNYMATGDLSNENTKELDFITHANRPSRADLTAKKGDVVLARMKATNKVLLVQDIEADYIYSTGFIVLRPSKVIDNNYLLHFLQSSTFQDEKDKLCTGATQKAINNQNFAQLQIPLPPLPIQKRIAEILDAADALKRKDQELLKKYDELAQAIFIDMFGDPVKNEKGWEVKRLDELLLKGEKISYGVVQPGDDFPNGVPIVRVGDFKLMKIDKTNLKKINPEIETTYNRTRLKGDEILIACVGSVGKIALADESLKGFNIVRATAKVRVDHNIINRTYLAFHLSQISIQNYFIAETRTSSQPTLNIKQIEETKILVPPIRIQNQFNLLSTDLLKQIEMVNDSNSDGLFQTLIQKAFKGELVAE